ncbi:MAG: hypothetical protein ACHQX3_10300, partial [Nitrospirales bacterium]
EKPEGLEHLTEADIQMPRLLIAQQMSPELNPAKPQYNEDLKQADLFNSLTGQIYGKGPIYFSIVRADPPRFVEFIPREQGGGVKDPKVPFGDPRTEWQADGKPPIATKFYDFIIMILQGSNVRNEMVALSFKSTGIKVARQLNGLATARMKPLWAGVYALSAVSTQNAKGSFFIPQVKNAGWIPPEMKEFCRQTFESLKHRVIDIDISREAQGVAETPDDTAFEPAQYEAEAAAESGGVSGM